MSDITASLQEAIKKHLPEQVGETLKKELQELETLRRTAEQLKSEHKDLEGRYDQSRREIEALKAQLGVHKAITDREIAVSAREQTQALRDLEVKMHKEMRVEMLGLVSTVFKSPVYQRSLNGNVPVPVEGQPGDPSRGLYPTPGTVLSGALSVTETHTQG